LYHFRHADFFLDEVAMYDRLLTVEEIKEDIEGALLGVESTGKLATVWDWPPSGIRKANSPLLVS